MKNDGGPAYPLSTTTRHWLGLSLRDLFAMEALRLLHQCGRVDPDEIAARAYEIADAMIIRRDK